MRLSEAVRDLKTQMLKPTFSNIPETRRGVTHNYCSHSLRLVAAQQIYLQEVLLQTRPSTVRRGPDEAADIHRH